MNTMVSEETKENQEGTKRSNRICNIEIRALWNRYDFIWKNLNPDVNILIGINGSGKTTLFNIIDGLLSGDVKRIKEYDINAKIELDDRTIVYTPKMTALELKKQIEAICYEKVSTFDIPLRDKKGKKEFSQLYQELYNLIYDIGGISPSFSDYRLKATNFPLEAKKVNDRIATFFDTVNRLFRGTQKIIQIDPYTNHLVFNDQGEVLPLHKLSSGEKQLLIILLKVFLMDEQPAILLMDEPEISLHIEWQHILFEEIRRLNSNCQIITSTHSPSLFGDGWSDKLFFVEDLVSPMQKV